MQLPQPLFQQSLVKPSLFQQRQLQQLHRKSQRQAAPLLQQSPLQQAPLPQAALRQSPLPQARQQALLRQSPLRQARRQPARQRGFTLIEMMVVIGIIAILSAVAIPAYQNYLRKAALTDMLQTFTPYRTAVELCAIDNGGVTGCNAGQQGIPASRTSNYVANMTVNQGVITLNGQKSLVGLSVVLTPQWSSAEGVTGWQRQCNIADNSSLQQACNDIFRLNSSQPPAQTAS